MSLLIKGGQVVDPASGTNEILDILVDEGRIVSLGESLPRQRGDTVIDAGGLMVIPGLVDMHVHLREPGREDAETIASGAAAACRGGFTSVACMPNTEPAIDSASQVRFVQEKAKAAGYANVYVIGAITKGRKGEELSEIGELKDSGAVAISDDGTSVASSRLMRHALEYSRRFDMPVIVHCEDADLAGDGVMHEGAVSTALGLRGINRAVEEIVVARDLILAMVTGGRLHVAHVSSKGSVDLIRAARQRGVRVSAEVTPHHLTLTDEAVRDFDTRAKVNPPLRSAEDREALRHGLVEGTIDCIATDHAPHTREDKEKEFDYAAFGMIGLEQALGVIVKELVDPGIITWMQLVEKMSWHPAQCLGVPKGTLQPGADADIAVIDPESEWVLDAAELSSRSTNTPFLGCRLKGRVIYTLVGGRIVVRDGKLAG